jgi:ABC-type uncharacterized transport system substrate-binding protein
MRHVAIVVAMRSMHAVPQSEDTSSNDRNVVIEYRWAGNDLARLEQQADEPVRLRVDVDVTAVTPAVRAAEKATATMPIVMVAAADQESWWLAVKRQEVVS